MVKHQLVFHSYYTCTVKSTYALVQFKFPRQKIATCRWVYITSCICMVTVGYNYLVSYRWSSFLMILSTVCSEFCLVTKWNLLEMRYSYSLAIYLHILQRKVLVRLIVVAQLQVHMQDQVIFASEENEGQYIHTSSRTYHQADIALHGHW